MDHGKSLVSKTLPMLLIGLLMACGREEAGDAELDLDLERADSELASVLQGCDANQVPAMTGPSAPSGVVTRSGSYSAQYEAWQAFDGNASSADMWISAVFQTPAWLGYEWVDGPRTVTRYAINFSNGSLTSRAPRDWTLQGWTGSAWVVVDTRSAQTGWLGTERREYTVASPGSYSKYRLHVTDDNDERAGVVVVSINRLELLGCH
jgi:hypothetical protein